MTLYLDTADGFRAWAGEAIADILHPTSIEDLWTDEELAAVGLYRPAAADPVPDGKIVASTTVERVDGVVRYVNTLADAPPPPVPMEISDRQFFQQLAIKGDISQAEALDAVGPGIIPAAMDALVGQLPADAQFGARMLIRGATIYRRDNPIAGLIRQLYGWSEADADDFWQAASAL